MIIISGEHLVLRTWKISFSINLLTVVMVIYEPIEHHFRLSLGVLVVGSLSLTPQLDWSAVRGTVIDK